MTALDDAITRIRGPRLEDFFSPDADQSFGPQPAMDPAALPALDTPPARAPITMPNRGAQKSVPWGITPSDPGEAAEQADTSQRRAEEFSSGLRFAGGFGPPVAGPLLAEAGASLADSHDHPITGKGFATRAGLGIAAQFARVPAAERLFTTLPRRMLGEAATAEGLGEGFKWLSYQAGEGEKPTVKGAVRDAPMNALMGAAFGAYAHVARGHQEAFDLHAKAAANPKEHGPLLAEAEAAHEARVTQSVRALDPGSAEYTAQAKALGEERLSPELRTAEGVDAAYERMMTEATGRRMAEAGIGDDAAPAPAGPGLANNASGESAASVEAINRQRGERAAGTRRLRVDGRSGKAIPLIGPEAVDAVPGPHDILVTQTGSRRQVTAVGAQVTPAGRLKALRPHQTGELRLSLVTDAMFKAAKGVKSLADYTKGAVEKWGEGVRPFLAGAWREGSKEAARAKVPGKTTPAETKRPIDQDLMTRIDAKAAEAQTRRGWTDPKVKARLEGTEKATMAAIEAAKAEPATPEGNAKQTERMLRLRAIAHERAGEVGPAKDAWTAVAQVKKANAAGKHGDTIAIGKKYGLSTRDVHEAVDRYTDPTDKANALRLAVQPTKMAALTRLAEAGVRWNFLGTLRVPLKIAYINATTTGLRAVATLPAAGYSRVMHRGNQHVYASELPPTLVGYFHGLPHGAMEALDIIKNGLTKEALMAGKYGHEFHTGNRAADMAINLDSRLLGATDHLLIQPWVEVETQALMSNRARARGIQMGRNGTALTDHIASTMERWTKQPPQWALEFKARTAKRMSDSAALGKWSETTVAIGETPFIGPLMRPFLRTAFNNTRRTVQTFVPGYGMGTAVNMHRAGRTAAGAEAYGQKIGWNKGEGTRAQQSGAFQREEAMRFGENVVGTLATSLLLKAILSGHIIGSAPVGMSSSERDQLAQERPWRSAWGYDANTILGPGASAGMALADAVGTYQHLTKIGEDPKKAKDVYDKMARSAGAAMMDLVKGMPLLDNQGQLGLDSFFRQVAMGVPFAPAIAKNVNALRGDPMHEEHGVKNIFKAEVLGMTSGLPERLSGVGEPIARRGVINPFSASPTHPNEARTNAARLGVQLPMPRLEFIKTLDGQQRKLSVPMRRIAELALGKANSLALDIAHRQSAGKPDDIGTEYYKAYISAYHSVVMDRLTAAATERRLITIDNLTAGLK